MTDQPYVHATTAEAAERWITDAAGARFVAVDTETTGWDAWSDRLLLVQLAAGPGRPVLVLDAERVGPGVLAPLLGDPGVLKVFHHGAFDLRFLAVAGVRVDRVADTMLAQQLLDGGAPTEGGLGLASLASFRLGMDLDKSLRASFAEGVSSAAQLRYAADDAAATWGVFDQQYRELVARRLTDVARLEFAALPAMADLALRGVVLDDARWRRLVGELEDQLPAIEARLQAELVTDDSPRDLFGPAPVNLDSPEQVREALARLGIDLPSTRDSVLRDHREHPAVAALLAYRQLHTVAVNWGGDWVERVRHPRTGRVHADWRQIVGAGRISCSDPNLTQIPKDPRYRSCFGGAPGRRLVVADYSQQELRILAAVSGDEALIEVFRRGGDLHRTTAAVVFSTSEPAVTPAERAVAKQLNFGLLYGMGAPGFARATGMTLAAAQMTMRRYFATFPRVAEWLEAAVAEGRRTGRSRTVLGRQQALGASAAATLYRNAPIQGAGADMTKLALAEVDALLRPRSPLIDGTALARDGLALVVHDELVVETSADAADATAEAVRHGMLRAAERILGDVPAQVDVAVRPRWSDDPPTG